VTLDCPQKALPVKGRNSRKNKYIGKSVTRLEDKPLVLGQGVFAGDINLPRQVYARVCRSPVAFGKLLEVETAEAKCMDGVVGVWVAADIEHLPPIPFRETAVQGLSPYRQPVLAIEYVRYVGEPLAVIFAETQQIAEDAADVVYADIRELPYQGSAKDEPGIFAPGLDTEPVVLEQGYGDFDAAQLAADELIELNLRIGRHSGIPLETRGALASWDPGRQRLDMYGTTKRPHWNRDQLAKMLGLSQYQIALHEPHVGGGFGIRGEIYPEDVLVCLGAIQLGRPVKWIEDRREHMIAANHSREQDHLVRAAVKQDGTILGIDEILWHDQGAYVRTHGARVAGMTIGLLLGPYKVPAYRAKAYYRLTNKTPAATYRAPGRFEGTFVRERLVDAIAERLDLTSEQVRRANFIKVDEMPYARGLSALETDVVIDSGNYDDLLSKARKAFGWERAEVEVAERRARGEAVGLALGFFVEKSGLGPSELVRINVSTSGEIEVVTGAASLGQGMETAIAQITAETLGVDYQKIRVVHGDTDRILYGFGAHASRVTVMTGEAARRAAVALKQKAVNVAASLIQSEPSELEITDGVVHSIKQGIGSIKLCEIARHLEPNSPTRGDFEPGLFAEAWFHNKHMNYPYGAHIAVVRVDQQTYSVEVEKYAITYDVGRAVNPAMIEGQIIGGLAQGIGGALFEEFKYDEFGQPLSVTLADYLMVSAVEMPPCDVLILEDAPSPLNPLGIKGAGEAGVTAAGAAIASAVDDALQRPGLVQQLPITPQYLSDRILQYDTEKNNR